LLATCRIPPISVVGRKYFPKAANHLIPVDTKPLQGSTMWLTCARHFNNSYLLLV
jgi:hypothetical protein